MNSIYFQYNVDENNNPVSTIINNEVKQISPISFSTQLEQIPDEHYRLEIKVENTILNECFNRDEIGSNSYYVDYGMGKVYFNSDKGGKYANILKYGGVGIELLSADRIFTKTGENTVDMLTGLIEDVNNAVVTNGIIKENYKTTILADSLVLNSSSGFYECNLNHNLNSSKIKVTVYEQGGSECVNLCKILDSNNILVRNDEKVALTIIINYGSVGE